MFWLLFPWPGLLSLGCLRLLPCCPLPLRPCDLPWRALLRHLLPLLWREGPALKALWLLWQLLLLWLLWWWFLLLEVTLLRGYLCLVAWGGLHWLRARVRVRSDLVRGHTAIGHGVVLGLPR